MIRITLLVIWLASIIVIPPYIIAPFYRWVTPLSTPMLYDSLIREPYRQNFTPLNNMGKRVAKLVLLAEDDTFCRNKGVNLDQAKIVIKEFLSGERPRGASTITMQLSKNLFLWSSRSYIRKALEIPLALWLNQVLSKQRILELYLNVATLGPGIYGIEAASKHYFKKNVAKLSDWQTALLITSLPNPIKRNAAKPSNKHSKLAKSLLKRFQRENIDISCLKLER